MFSRAHFQHFIAIVPYIISPRFGSIQTLFRGSCCVKLAKAFVLVLGNFESLLISIFLPKKIHCFNFSLLDYLLNMLNIE